MNKNMIMWSVSLIVIGVVTLLLAGSKLADVSMPDVMTRLLGIIDLIALAVLTYSSVRRWKEE